MKKSKLTSTTDSVAKEPEEHLSLDEEDVLNQDYLKMLKELGVNYMCEICDGILQNPYSCSECQRTFCKFCIDQWMAKGNGCLYRCEGAKFKLNRQMRDFLSKLKFKGIDDKEETNKSEEPSTPGYDENEEENRKMKEYSIFNSSNYYEAGSINAELKNPAYDNPAYNNPQPKEIQSSKIYKNTPKESQISSEKQTPILEVKEPKKSTIKHAQTIQMPSNNPFPMNTPAQSQIQPKKKMSAQQYSMIPTNNVPLTYSNLPNVSEVQAQQGNYFAGGCYNPGLQSNYIPQQSTYMQPPSYLPQQIPQQSSPYYPAQSAMIPQMNNNQNLPLSGKTKKPVVRRESFLPQSNYNLNLQPPYTMNPNNSGNNMPASTYSSQIMLNPQIPQQPMGYYKEIKSIYGTKQSFIQAPAPIDVSQIKYSNNKKNTMNP